MAGDAAGVWEGVSAPGQEGGQPEGLEGERVWAGPTLTSLPLDWDPGGNTDILGEGGWGAQGWGELVCVGSGDRPDLEHLWGVF